MKAKKALGTGIYIFGHKLGDDDLTPENIGQYIGEDIFTDHQGRYRYTDIRPKAKKIVLTLKGIAYGHFLIRYSEAPTDEDRRDYPPTSWVYLVESSVRYSKPFHLKELGIKVYNRPPERTEEEFQRIVERGIG
jgi:hypothetical protein